ncbi:hypothetical protein [Thermomonas flagellata]|uniref:hypothetical protein n=1 Tax=Thermomonas flagellata TaxID=2888524 RepID=UPI001F041F31|nr:hypothetical protein [Thermomonas flagellata]
MSTESEDPRLQLVAPGPRARRWLAGVMLLPLLVVVLAGQFAPGAAGGSRGAFLVGLGVLGLLWCLLDRALRRHRLRLEPEALDIATTFYHRRVALAQLDLAHARVVRLAEHTAFKPLLKLNGYALPGIQSGHFLLRDRRRAFVATAGGERVLWLPVRGQPGLLLEVGDPGALLARLQALAPGATRA